MEFTAASAIPALATLAAALMAGGIARSNLIVSKESKISEFRQAWIGELRENLSSLFSAVRLLARAVQDERDKERGNGSNPKFHFSPEKIVEIRHSALETKYSIELLLDAKREHQGELRRLLDAMMDTQTTYLTGGNDADIEPVFDAVGLANEQAALVLTHEWEMVRRGEDEYRNAVKTANSVLLVAGVLLAAITAFVFFSPLPTAVMAATQTPQTNQSTPASNGTSKALAAPVEGQTAAQAQQDGQAAAVNNIVSKPVAATDVAPRPAIKSNDVGASKK